MFWLFELNGKDKPSRACSMWLHYCCSPSAKCLTQDAAQPLASFGRHVENLAGRPNVPFLDFTRSSPREDCQ
eukprot:scaffold106749_cov25-Tisochrysis_lutea.AAC.2